jgi:deoxyribodipyrimidine photo-lyase
MVDRPPIIVWFRDDLGLSDHPAQAAAAKTGSPHWPLRAVDPGGAFAAAGKADPSAMACDPD